MIGFIKIEHKDGTQSILPIDDIRVVFDMRLGEVRKIDFKSGGYCGDIITTTDEIWKKIEEAQQS